MKKIISKLKSTKKSHKIYGSIGVVVVVIIALMVGNASSADDNISEESKARQVEVFNLGSDTVEMSYVNASGKVESSSEASLSVESSGVVKSVNVSSGQEVSKGQLLVSLGGSDAYAQVAQAQAGLDLQLSRYQELLNGPRSEVRAVSQARVDSAKTALSNAEFGLSDAIETSVFKLDDVVGTSLEPLFRDGFGTSVTQNGSTYRIGAAPSDSTRISLAYSSLKRAIDKYEEVKNSEKDVLLKAGELEQLLVRTVSFMDDLAVLINASQSSNSSAQAVYNSFIQDISQSRTSVQSALTGLRGSTQALKSAQSGLDSAKLQYDSDTASPAQTEIQIQQAQVAQARASLLSAQSMFAKTQVRAPFSGSVIAMNVTVGQFVSPGNPIISMINEQGKQLKVFLSGEDASKVFVGNAVKIEGGAVGVVSSVGRGIDPSTGKIEATIQIEGNSEYLLVGNFVNVEIASSPIEDENTTSLFVPLQSVKAKSIGSVVYVIENETLREQVIQTGQIRGTSIEVTGGLMGDESIALKASGLADGMKVNPVNNN